MELDIINLNYVLTEIKLELERHRDWLTKEIAYVKSIECKVNLVIETLNRPPK